ncbi:MAG: hypothetical protein HQK64_06800 [Desulfamplus sp.]|nr:hypothetical protein [Desulfamplus sp.]
MRYSNNINNDYISAEILKHLSILSVKEQEQVLEFVIKLKKTDFCGSSSDTLVKYAGTISFDDLDIISKVIEDDCTRIDIMAWDLQ